MLRPRVRLVAMALWSLAVWILGVPLVALLQSGDPHCWSLADQVSRDACTNGAQTAGAVIIGTVWLMGLLAIILIFRLTKRPVPRGREP